MSSMSALSALSLVGIQTGKGSDLKLGLTTTIREQIASIQNAADSFDTTILSQRKQQQTTQLAMNQLQTVIKQSFCQLNKEVEGRLSYLQGLFERGIEAQEKEFEYLQMQNSALLQEQTNMQEVTSQMTTATSQIESGVGL